MINKKTNLSHNQTKELIKWLNRDKTIKEVPSMMEILEILQNDVDQHKSLYGLGEKY